MIYFTSDWHLGDDRIGIDGKPNLFFRPFSSVEEQDETIVSELQKFVGKEDTLIHLGDVLVGDDSIETFRALKGMCKEMILISGNYDEGRWELLGECFDQIYHEWTVELDGIPFYLNHYPSRCKGNAPALTGHIHSLWKVQPGMINVGVDAWHFRPVSEKEILFCWQAMQNHYDQEVFVYGKD